MASNSLYQGLNVRDANGRVIRSLGPETAVTVYGIMVKDGGRWAKIGTNEYVSADYLKMSCGCGGGYNNQDPTLPDKLQSPKQKLVYRHWFQSVLTFPPLTSDTSQHQSATGNKQESLH
ncbi:predicted protein [Naegleria gruberi]|uniref:Predicted protein n=1 Tax=Naegleria gruberi TaxID=5762 RepID=D2VPU4_NAEGR|nr:uncharacterized protein NAEGRDRAFT_70989 [Naegleria gruberi]EFC41185.1 predicted protein [Naegleria gruberi]|eukprot:XP_002673929.1 predicted protein [Naegleria gruberi strain NEG-M]